MSFFTAEILLPSAENVANASSAVEKLKFMLHSYQAMPIELYDYAKHLNPAEFDEISVGRREIRGRIWTSVCATGDRSNQSFNEIVEFAFQKNALLRYGMEVKFADENRLEMCPKGCADADLDELSAVKQHINNESARKTAALTDFESRINQIPASSNNATVSSRRELHNFLMNLADRYRIQGGHWTIYASGTAVGTTRSPLLSDIPDIWSKLLSSFFFGFLILKASMVRSRMSPDGVALAVHTGKWEPTMNKEMQNFDLEKAIRLADIYADMKFKMDIYSVCGIVHGDRANWLGLRPTLYRSSVRPNPENERQIYSEIRTDYTLDYVPVNDFFARGRGCDHYQNIWAVGVEQWAPEMRWDYLDILPDFATSTS